MDLSSRKKLCGRGPLDTTGRLVGSFGTWLISEADTGTGDDPKRLISLAGQIRPLIKNRIDQELRKSLREITEELTQVFYDAYHGKNREADDSIEGVPNTHIIWEFPISNKPLQVAGKILRMGTVAIAYQFPAEAAGVVPSDLKAEEREKFLRERSKFFMEFLKGSLLKSEAIDKISDDLTYKFHTSNGRVIPTLLWTGKITGNNGKRLLGRIVVAHRVLGGKQPEF